MNSSNRLLHWLWFSLGVGLVDEEHDARGWQQGRVVIPRYLHLRLGHARDVAVWPAKDEAEPDWVSRRT